VQQLYNQFKRYFSSSSIAAFQNLIEGWEIDRAYKPMTEMLGAMIAATLNYVEVIPF
jgi:hypothetical protein